MKFESIIKDIINESDKRQSIQNAIGFSEEWANVFHDMDEKLSIWIANTFLNDFMVNKSKNLVKNSRDKKAVLEFLNKMGSKSSIWRDEYEPNYRYIFDWVRSPRRREQINVKVLSFADALQKSREWHESLEDKVATNYDEKNHVVIDYRNKDGIGFYWVDLKTDYSQEESERMGHCGRDSGCTLFSLRSLNEFGESRSHITASYRSNDGVLAQIKGRKNSKPKPAYYKYIMDLLMNDEYPINALTKNTYASESNFHLSDLTTEQLELVFAKNKELKIYHLYGDKKKINTNKTNDAIVLFKEEGKNGYYGVVNVEDGLLIKDYEYVIDEDSKYTEFLHFPKTDQVVILKHFISKKSSDNFIIKVSNKLFDFIDKDRADKILSSDDWEDLESWYETKKES